MSHKTCAHCGETFRKDPRNTWAYWEKAKYCSQKCAGLANSMRKIAIRPSLEEAFFRWSVKTDGCWEWNGARDKDGYGIFNYGRKSYRAAKVALQIDGRPVPNGKLACHHCDNPPCVRPEHLYPGTHAQNCADTKMRGRVNYGRAAKLSPDDVRAIRAAVGTHSSIAADFRVSPASVTMIRNRKTWANVQ